jgi:alkylation response protein AidB-like acyl-CoA dehydrogenase
MTLDVAGRFDEVLEPGGDLEAFRRDVREWCSTHIPTGWREQQRGASAEGLVTFLRWWGTQLREAGLLAPHWPKEWGGGFSIPEQVVIAEELARGDAPRNGLYHVAIYNAAPTLLHSATRAQQGRFLRGIWNGEVWCQGFSEPNAGSDLASLQTRAVRDGDNYIVTGQKVWTSWAMQADWCVLLARTDPAAPKHKGLSCLVMDMHSPGVEVRPIKQATGAASFNEMFIDEVVIPVEHRVGAENDGWAVAQGTLSSERALVILEMTERLRRNGVAAAVMDAGSWSLESGESARDDPAVREMLAECHAEAVVLRHMLNAMIDDVVRGADVGGTSAIIKIFYTELLTKLMRQVANVQGLHAQLDQPLLEIAGWETGFWLSDYVHSFGWAIGGGTSEILRNVIGERMLGLPR